MAELDGQADDTYVARAVRLNDGGVIIYDPENEDAWIQSDSTIALSEPENAE